jgi:PAS domain S-box-containing protein
MSDSLIDAIGSPIAAQFPRSSHAVQFYEDDAFLANAVAGFLSDGFGADEPAVVIATPAHRTAFRDRLENLGVDVDARCNRGELLMLDAEETLAQFMNTDSPDETRFAAVIGSVISKAAASTAHARVRAYGEMVDVLWRAGQPDAAIRLEELWNDLGEVHTFSLLCAYPMANFFKESHAAQFDHICRTHTHVIAAEGQNRASDIAALQQRARALETEIEHRKQLEAALRESLNDRRRAERELKDFVENATVAMHWVSGDGNILWANEEELKLLGYTREEYVGRAISDFHADEATINDILARLKSNQEIRDYEARLIAKDGSIRHVEISSNVLFENGKFVHTRCFTRDVTDRKRLEAERLREDLANAFLLDATSALHRTLDFDELLKEVAALAVPRLAAGCAVDIARGDGTFERIATAGEIGSVATVIPMNAGDELVGQLALFGESGSFDHTTEAEFARRAAISIENARLYRLAQEANRTKDEFLATLSHELRTPLTAILGWARMIMLGSLDADTMRTAVETIERSARTQATIIDDLLDLSRVVTGKLTLQSDLVDLSTVVQNAVQTLQLAAEAKGICVDTSIAAGSSVVTGDATRLQQVVWNLLSNAIKFSDRGGRVELSLQRSGGHARVSVSDSGRGIPTEFLPHVFEPFRQADGAASRAYGGLGLGLAIVKYLTELHGGTVRADSAGPGSGATFSLTFPLASRRVATAEPAQVEMADLKGMDVLLVDDDDDTRTLVAAILRHRGAQVQTVASADEARKSVAAKAPHVIVTDIAMPGKDGFSLLHALRNGDESARNIPTIAVTAFGDAGTEEKLREAGFNAFVRKPIDPTKFVRVVADLRPKP